MDEEIEFGYSLRFSMDDKTVDIQLRFEEPCGRRDFVEALRALVIEQEKGLQEGEYDQ